MDDLNNFGDRSKDDMAKWERTLTNRKNALKGKTPTRFSRLSHHLCPNQLLIYSELSLFCL